MTTKHTETTRPASGIGRIWRSYVDLVCRYTPIYRRSVPRLTIGFALVLIGIGLWALFGDIWMVGVFAVAGVSLMGEFQGDIRHAWDTRNRKRDHERE
ncbi:hypothetical protein WI697_04495 [Tistrella mobilis]|uniref:hypothetical protein n=1 Tax=Tistrella mobilis TaxID=171437 RepID=UPI0031F6656F